MTEKEILGSISVIIATIGYIFYIKSIVAKKTRPHVFSWILWTLILGIGFAAQLTGKPGPGAWGLGFATTVSFFITLLSFPYGEKSITRGDWISLIAALAALPLWHFTKDPLGAVILISVVEIISCYPTLRKIWIKPREEDPRLYAMAGLRNAISLFALKIFSLITALYMIVLVALNATIVFVILYRRALKKS